MSRVRIWFLGRFLALLGAVVVLALSGATAAIPSSLVVARVSFFEKTKVYGPGGKLLLVIVRQESKYSKYWEERFPHNDYGESWVGGNAARGWGAGYTHNELGGAVGPFGPQRNRWKVWERRSLKGSMIRRSSTRWDIYSRTGRFIAYTKGPDGGAAATWYLIFEVD
jgi:hypothetical protein